MAAFLKFIAMLGCTTYEAWFKLTVLRCVQSWPGAPFQGGWKQLSNAQTIFLTGGGGQGGPRE